jgi:hypothetical protein
MTRAIPQLSLVSRSRNRERKVTLFARKVTHSGGKVTLFPRKGTLLGKFAQDRVTGVNTPRVEG